MAAPPAPTLRAHESGSSRDSGLILDILDLAITSGFQAAPTKMGSGEKKQGVLLSSRRLKSFLLISCFALLGLGALAVGFLVMYNVQIARRVQETFMWQEQHEKDATKAIRLGVALQQALVEHSDSVTDTNRVLKRVSTVVEIQFEEIIKEVSKKDSVTYDELSQVLSNAKDTIAKHVSHDIDHISRDAIESEKKTELRLQKLAEMQERSLRDLLKSMSGMKMEMFEEILEDLFEATWNNEGIKADLHIVDELEHIANELNKKAITLREGLEKFENIRPEISNLSAIIPPHQLEVLKNPSELGSILENVASSARLSHGRKEILEIEKQWRENMELAEKRNEDGDFDKQQEEEEIECTIEAIMRLHRLVSLGRLPISLLEFEMLPFDVEQPIFL